MASEDAGSHLRVKVPAAATNSPSGVGSSRREHRLPGAVWFVLAGSMVALAAVTGQGADLLWGVAMGDQIRAGHGVPQSVSFASAPSDGWTNPMAVGETLLSIVHSLGPSALVVLHLLLVATALAILVRHGVSVHHREARASVALVLVVFGGATTLAIARMPSLSLVPFALLAVLLVGETDRSSARLWLTVPLLAIWGNLHGGVLVGCALLTAYLIFHGGRLRRRLLIGGSSFAVVLLVTSAGWRTLDYYRDVLGNEAARQHSGLWARPALDKPIDLVMLLATACLILMWARSRPRRWEVVAVLGMVAGTLLASRNNIWLLLFLLPLASIGRPRANSPDILRFPWKPAAAALVLLIAGVGWQLRSRGPALDARGTDAIPTVRKLAGGQPVLAIDPVDETFTQAGIRVWAGNPIDAFPRRIQRQFLRFMDKGVVPPDTSIGLVVVNQTLANRIRSAGWHEVASADGLLLFKRSTQVTSDGGTS